MDAPVPLIVAALLAAAALVAPCLARARGRDARRARAHAGPARRPHLARAQFRTLRDRPASPRRPGRRRSWRSSLLALAIRRRPSGLPVAGARRRCRSASRSRSGGSTANLLVPLYVVIAAGALAYAVPRLRGASSEVRAAGAGRARVGAARPASCSTRVQAVYSDDFDRALEHVVFFYVPFALLFVLSRGSRGRRGWRVACLGVLVVLALAFVGDRLLRVRDAPPAAEPEGHRLQPGRGLLPRQLAVLRPEHLRALPRARDDRARRRAALGEAPARRDRRGRRARWSCSGAGWC